MAIEHLQPIEGSQVWYGPEFTGREEVWTHVLSEAEISELDLAVDHVLARGIDIVDMRQTDFPLPMLAPTLQNIREEVLNGRGFYLLRGLPVERYSQRQSAIALFGIGTHWGEAVSQNAKGHVLGHVRDLNFDYNQPTSRGYQTSARLPYHTDASDLAALLCLKTAKSGGKSSFVSSVTLYNEMLRRRPDLAAVLTQPVYRDRRGEIPKGMQPWYTIPVFNLHSGRVLTSYVRSAVRKAQRFDEVPRLSDALNEAMDMLDALAESPDFHLDMSFQTGDIQVVNNHYIMHSRTAFEDYDEPDRKRHLMRLWLGCADGPELPPAYQNYQGLTDAGRPNGYLLDGIRFVAPLDAEDGGPGDSEQRFKV